MFVREADLSYDLGPAAARPYVDLAVLERALTESGADAVWPGWGFMAEDPAFVDLCDRLGVTFIGPSAEAMRRLGYTEQVHASLSWMLHATAHTHPRLRPMYRLDGRATLPDRPLDLDGWRGSRPVTLGNGAQGQLQLGSYGDVFDMAWHYVDDGNALVRIHNEFHAVMIELAGNQTMSVLSGMVRHIIDKSSFQHVAADAGSAANIRSIRKGFRAHELLIEHIEARDADAAEALWGKHLAEAERYMLSDANPKTVLDLLE